MPLHLTSLTKSIDRLAEALTALRTSDNDALIRDAVIQRFEFTYEISHKMLKRYLEITSPDPQIFEGMAFAQLIRTGSEQGLLRSGWDRWKAFRQARSITSHTYDEGKAKDIVLLVPEFLDEARFLLEELRKKIPQT